jgi:hypothetical protein
MTDETTTTSANPSNADSKTPNPESDVRVVHDAVPTSEQRQQIQQDLVSNVTKMLEGDDASKDTPGSALREPETPASPKKPEADGDEAEAAESEPDSAQALSEDLQARVKVAGLSDELAQQLHQSGQLEETLAAFDRSLIQYVQSKAEPDDEPDTPVTKPDEQQQNKQRAEDPKSSDDDIPPLDPELYDEALVKRDAYQQRRIDMLEAKLEALLEQQHDGFDEWFDGALSDLGVDIQDESKCQKVYKAYSAMCDAFGASTNARDTAIVQRAYAAMYPQEVFRQKQQQTVDRLRDAQGKFLTSPRTQGAPPPREATPEEVNDRLVHDVTAYLKDQGVQMSGI